MNKFKPENATKIRVAIILSVVIIAVGVYLVEKNRDKVVDKKQSDAELETDIGDGENSGLEVGSIGAGAADEIFNEADNETDGDGKEGDSTVEDEEYIVGEDMTNKIDIREVLEDIELLSDFEGNLVNMEDYKGKKLAVLFWASYCTPCQSELPIIQELISELEKDTKFLTINVEENIEDAKELMDKEGYTFDVLLAKDREIMDKQGIEGIPTILVYNTDRTIVKKYTGRDNKETLIEEISAMD